MDDFVNTIVSRFNESFSHWGVKLPIKDGRVPERGKIMEAGWVIWFLFGDSNGEPYLDYYASHRMTDDRHVRLHTDGHVEELPAIESWRVVSDDPAENAKLQRDFLARNNETEALLEKKGFRMSGDEPGLLQVNRWLHLHPADPVSESFEKLVPERRSGNEPLHDGGKPVGSTLVDFWSWASSDLLANQIRGVYAEWLVGTAIGASDAVRNPWDAVDFRTPNGVTVEVKSSSYVQSWKQSKPSRPVFSIAPAILIDENSVHSEERKRRAEVYVFCLLNEQDQRMVDPLNVRQWRFFVLSTKVLDERLGAQKTLSLSVLQSLSPEEVDYDEVRSAIERVAIPSLSPKPPS